MQLQIAIANILNELNIKQVNQTMKKKIKLSVNELKVKSFVTGVLSKDDNAVKGGGTLYCPTKESCYDYISCSPVQCTFTYLRYCNDTNLCIAK